MGKSQRLYYSVNRGLGIVLLVCLLFKVVMNIHFVLY
jgi:hypothetical protein